jgi:SAM-dependent methyltransferase
VVGSEYREGVAAGEKFKTPFGKVRNEDVTALSFYDRKFHAVLSFDVLEHVPDYRAALSEFYRVLCTGGQLLLSVPFVFDQHTRIRARLDANGEIEHLLEPVYHGDPVSHEGVLCFYEFGMDLLDDIRQAGFQESFLVCYHSKGWGYEGAQVMFVGRKRG